MVGKSDTQKVSTPKLPVIKYAIKESKRNAYLTPIPKTFPNKKRLYLQLPTTVTIEPWETEVIDLKIYILLPEKQYEQLLLGRLNLSKETLRSYKLEIKHDRSFFNGGDVKAHITNNSNNAVILKVGSYPVTLTFFKPSKYRRIFHPKNPVMRNKTQDLFAINFKLERLFPKKKK